MDHLLNAFEEFFPFIERVAQKTEKVTQNLQMPGARRREYRRRRAEILRKGRIGYGGLLLL